MNREVHVRFCERLRVRLPRPTYQSGANTAAVNGMVADSGVAIELRQSKYLNNLIEQDHRAIKRIVRPMLGFKDFDCARRLIAGIETMHMVKKGQARLPQRRSLVRC
jgi:putative transposase